MSNYDSLTMPKQGQICWNELTTHDADKAKAFYSELFNWQFVEHPLGTDSAVKGYTCFKVGDEEERGGILQIPSEGEYSHMPTRWLSYIYVNNIEEMTKKAEELGAKVKVPITDVGNFGRFSVLLDPTGAEIAFWQSLIGE